MLKKIVLLVAVLILLAGSIWFAGNIIAYNKCWNGLSQDLRSEWENTGAKEENPVGVFIKRGFGMGLPEGLDELREPRTSVIELQYAVWQLQKKDQKMQAEIDDLKSRIGK